jgi:hypothetical protein
MTDWQLSQCEFGVIHEGDFEPSQLVQFAIYCF